jgi:hypothetical protein
MEKGSIQNLIDKYHLGGLVESVTWGSTDTNTSVSFITPTKDCVGIINTTEDLGLGNNNISIYSTSQLNKLLSIMDGSITIDVVKGNQDIPYQLNIKNKSFDLDFYLSSDDLIPPVPNISEPDEYEIEFNLDDDFIKDFTRAHTSLDKPNRFTVGCKVVDDKKLAEFTIGEGTTYANKVKLTTPASYVIGFNELPFSASIFREILLSNKTAKGKIKINEEGLMKIIFIEDNITSTYFLVRSSD